MAKGSKTPADILRIARFHTRRQGIVLRRKVTGGRVHGKGSHQVWQLVEDDTVLAQTIIPGHSEDVAIGTLRNIERAFESVLGKGWLDHG